MDTEGVLIAVLAPITQHLVEYRDLWALLGASHRLAHAIRTLRVTLDLHAEKNLPPLTPFLKQFPTLTKLNVQTFPETTEVYPHLEHLVITEWFWAHGNSPRITAVFPRMFPTLKCLDALDACYDPATVFPHLESLKVRTLIPSSDGSSLDQNLPNLQRLIVDSFNSSEPLVLHRDEMEHIRIFNTHAIQRNTSISVTVRTCKYLSITCRTNIDQRWHSACQIKADRIDTLLWSHWDNPHAHLNVRSVGKLEVHRTHNWNPGCPCYPNLCQIEELETVCFESDTPFLQLEGWSALQTVQNIISCHSMFNLKNYPCLQRVVLWGVLTKLLFETIDLPVTLILISSDFTSPFVEWFVAPFRNLKKLILAHRNLEASLPQLAEYNVPLLYPGCSGYFEDPDVQWANRALNGCLNYV